MRRHFFACLTFSAVLIGALPHSAQGQFADAASANAAKKHHVDKNGDDKENDSYIEKGQVKNPVLWHDPGSIASLDLYYGMGGKDGMPKPPFTFESEDLNQSTPKFDARDANGTKWRGKLGHEARPEVVASRLLWATGYFVNIDYTLPEADVKGIRMKRGKKYLNGEHMKDVRFARKPNGQKKIFAWTWKENPFTGTRELNGLRVMMAVINSWDLKDENNAVFSDKKTGRQIFLVSDVGTAFGRTGLHFTNAPSKDNAEAYAASQFVIGKTDTTVDFANPTPTPSLLVETLGAGEKQYRNRNKMLWIGRGIPRADAKWVGSLLGQLSHQQLVDAFRAGNYPQADIDLFVKTLESRIRDLNAL